MSFFKSKGHRRRRRTDRILLDFFPVEILQFIIRELDCHSIKALLCSYPRLWKYTILVHDLQVKSDQAVMDSLFFDITYHGIQKIRLDEVIQDPTSPGNPDKKVLSKIRSHHLIKLIEIENRSASNTPTLSKYLPFIADECTFIHVADIWVGESFTIWKDSIKQMKSLPHMVYGNVPSCPYSGRTYSQEEKYEIRQCNQGYMDYNRLDYIHSPSSTVRSAETNWLKHLSFGNVNCVENLTLRYLESLTVVFDKPCENPEEAPHLSWLDLPQLSQLSLQFIHHPPYFHGVEAGYNRNGQETSNSLFQICHTGGYDVFRDPIVNRDYRNLVDYEWTTRMLFTENFERFNLVGIPDGMFAALSLRSATEINWVKSVKYRENTSVYFSPQTPLQCPVLRGFTCRTNIVRTVLPYFTLSRESPVMYSVRIYTNARHLELSRIFPRAMEDVREPIMGSNSTPTRTFGLPLRTVEVVCDLPAEHIGGNGHIVLSPWDLEALFTPGISITKRTLEGCLFGEDNDMMRYPIFGNTYTSLLLADVKIKFVRCVKQKEIAGREDDLLVTLFRHTKIKPQSLVIDQCWAPSLKPWKRVVLPINVLSQYLARPGRWMPCSVSSTFRYATLDDYTMACKSETPGGADFVNISHLYRRFLRTIQN